MALVDQQRLRTIVEIDENDSYTTNSLSSCFTSPSIDNSPPAIRRLQTLTITPRSTYDLWSSGIYSSSSVYDTNPSLTQKLTINSDSGRESADSSFSSENELSPPIKRYTRSLTIYQIEKAKQRDTTRSKSSETPKSRCTFTSSTKVFINEDDKRCDLQQAVKESEPSTTILKIHIPPNVQQNVADRFAKHQQKQMEEEKKRETKPFQMDISSPKTHNHQRILVTPKYGVNSSTRDYSVKVWENNERSEPGRIENYTPEVDRWHNNNEEVVNSSKRNSNNSSSASIASSSLHSSAIVEPLTPPNNTQSVTQIEHYILNCNPPVQVDPDKLNNKVDLEEDETGNTLSDISSCTSDSSEKSSSLKSNKSIPPNRSFGLKNLIEDNDPPSFLSRINNSNSLSSTDTYHSVPSNNTSSVKVYEMSDSMLQDRIVEVGVQPWKSESVKQYTNKPLMGPKLIEERTKKRVIFPDHPTQIEPQQQQHVYENIDDCREQNVEHPRKILPIPANRLPFKQPARVPVLSVHKQEMMTVDEPEDLFDVGPEISFVSYRFYDKNMQEQNSLSKRCSAQLLRKSAMRLSLPRKPNSNFLQRKQEELNVLPRNYVKTATAPLRYQIGQRHFPTIEDDIVTVNGKQTCANCHLQLGKGQAMTIDSLGLFYHLHCFRCSQCGTLLSSGDAKGMDVRVNGSQIQCNQCYNFSDGGFHYSQI